MKVSAQATPRPETMPERRFLLSVRWMQSTATGPTVIEAATPTPMPRRRIAKISKPISSLFRIQIAKIGKQSQFRSGDTEKRRTGGHKVSGSAGSSARRKGSDPKPGVPAAAFCYCHHCCRLPLRLLLHSLLLSYSVASAAPTLLSLPLPSSRILPSCCRILPTCRRRSRYAPDGSKLSSSGDRAAAICRRPGMGGCRNPGRRMNRERKC